VDAALPAERLEVGLEGALAAAAVGELVVQPRELLRVRVDLVEDDHVVPLEEASPVLVDLDDQLRV
jgi:hypothetical protein